MLRHSAATAQPPRFWGPGSQVGRQAAGRSQSEDSHKPSRQADRQQVGRAGRQAGEQSAGAHLRCVYVWQAGGIGAQA